MTRQVIVSAGAAGLHAAPDMEAEQTSQALFGEALRVLEETEDGRWLRARLERDGYEGWLRAEDVLASESAAGEGAAEIRIVGVPSTFLFSRADIKSRPLRVLPMGSRLRATGQEGRFLSVRLGPLSGFVIAAHVLPTGSWKEDPATVACAFLHAPYLWGGCTVHGIDCSGLVQMALMICGHRDIPRDSGPQMQQVGTPLPVETVAAGELRRGDLVFWKGHVAMALDARTIVHANAHHMCVAKEGVQAAVERIAAQGGGPVLAVRRP